ncbi:MAG: 50S ribosomal protein L30 [Deltaproteobacteria bacterium CG_4_10_14_0_2_um_filter_43_8]|nr:MAG: 50S ribosomal protein L30 [Deltaproteobacteria bacterium CG11_big_fil_rev_8_21_14_0_20_42_23]PJA21591.1 MAG: 50S ribosomal protein L30 [Deltaproteobacteria bacterium CG_4_10_14_0_2_um_filter_43_8]PJC64619.1 MAG: 50S ribosomal protein L30 [Deltaproteobacteria bacterium CG_4_9_14_0_2_um_filter_42_21]
MAKQIKVKLVKSVIGCPKPQRDTVRGLGLARVGNERVLLDTPAIRGMVKAIPHLVKIIEA